LGLGKLGFLVDLISEPVIVGFTTGSAFLIAGTQITNFLSIPKCGDKGAEPCWSDLGFVDTVNENELFCFVMFLFGFFNAKKQVAQRWRTYSKNGI